MAADRPAGGDQPRRAVSRQTVGVLLASTDRRLSLLTGSSFEPVATGFGCAAVALLLAAGLRPSRERRRWVPFAVAAACYAFMPWAAVNTAYLYQRFAVFLIPLALLGFDAAPPRAARWLQAATLALVLRRDRPQRHAVPPLQCRGARLQRHRGGRGAVAAPHLPRIRRRCEGLRDVALSPLLGVRPAEKGGTINCSFAQAPVAVMQYRPGRASRRATGCTCSRTCSTGASTATTTTSWSARARPTRAICFQPMRPCAWPRTRDAGGCSGRSNPTGGNSRRVGPTGARLSYLPSLAAPGRGRDPSAFDAAPGKSKPRARCSGGISAIFAVVITPTLATVGAEVRLILSTTEIAATHLHCLPT